MCTHSKHEIRESATKRLCKLHINAGNNRLKEKNCGTKATKNHNKITICGE